MSYDPTTMWNRIRLAMGFPHPHGYLCAKMFAEDVAGGFDGAYHQERVETALRHLDPEWWPLFHATYADEVEKEKALREEWKRPNKAAADAARRITGRDS